MTQEEKQLLLQDLCARLPYGIKILHRGAIEEIAEITLEGLFQNRSYYNAWFDISTCKPYLRPMSSMTEEEKIEYGDHCYFTLECISTNQQHYFNELYDWLNSHHFDYHGLIEKGLAIAVTEENNNRKTI